MNDPELLEEIERLEGQLHEVRDLATRADRITRDLAHRATTGDTVAQSIETELGAFLADVARVA